jgi:hypothetical protein
VPAFGARRSTSASSAKTGPRRRSTSSGAASGSCSKPTAVAFTPPRARSNAIDARRRTSYARGTASCARQLAPGRARAGRRGIDGARGARGVVGRAQRATATGARG